MLSTLIVIGTGFMGASIAAAAKAHRVAANVIGVDPKEAQQALAKGWIDRVGADIPSAMQAAITAANSSFASTVARLAEHSANEPAAESELPQIAVLIAAPVTACDAIFRELESVAERMDGSVRIAWVSDIGSTKHGVMRAAQTHFKTLAPRFVSSHPMAGSEKHGSSDANPQLLTGARVLVSAMPASALAAGSAAASVPYPGSAQDAIDELESFWLALGAIPNPLPMDDHDPLLAAISHLPHVLAYSLAASLAESPLAAAAQALHGGGLRDTTRIAASSAELWADIFLDNRESLLQTWGDWSLQLQGMRAALEKADRALLVDMLSRASQWRRGFQ